MQNKAQFTRLVDTHRAGVFRLAYGYLRSRADAEDVVQDVFLRLLRREEPFADDEHAKRWLYRVTLNECASVYRALRRRPENIDDYVETLATPGPHHDELIRQVMALPTRYRTALILYYYEGYSTREVAGLLGVPEATVRTRLARGRRKLRTVLGDETRAVQAAKPLGPAQRMTVRPMVSKAPEVAKAAGLAKAKTAGMEKGAAPRPAIASRPAKPKTAAAEGSGDAAVC